MPDDTGRKSVENDQYAAFMRRIIRAYARRISDGDIEALADMARLADDLDHATTEAVRALHRFGYSWTDIAARLGVTRQAAQQRYGTTNGHQHHP